MGIFFASTAKNPTIQETKICKEYTIEATIQNKMRLDKCDAYTAKKALGYKGRKAYIAVTRRPANREKNQGGTRGKTNTQNNNQSSPKRRR